MQQRLHSADKKLFNKNYLIINQQILIFNMINIWVPKYDSNDKKIKRNNNELIIDESK